MAIRVVIGIRPEGEVGCFSGTAHQGECAARGDIACRLESQRVVVSGAARKGDVACTGIANNDAGKTVGEVGREVTGGQIKRTCASCADVNGACIGVRFNG